MKFQNSSIHGFKVILCIKKRDERTDGRTNNPEAICPSNFFEVGGITKDESTDCRDVPDIGLAKDESTNCRNVPDIRLTRAGVVKHYAPNCLTLTLLDSNTACP